MEPTPSPSTPAARWSKGEPLPEGMVLGRFQVLHLAGAGGMGEVYRAWDSLLERHVALKSVRPRDGEDDTLLSRFQWEARALAQLSHPNVCQVYDLVTFGDETFIAMEWLEGETLDRAAPRMDRGARLKAVRDVARGLAAAHAKGLVHRDLKPGNIMVCAGGEVKILDFGLARLGVAMGAFSAGAPDPLGATGSSAHASMVHGGDLATALVPGPGQTPLPTGLGAERLTHLGAFIGSPRYASPEQIRGELAGPATDVWSLGLVAWELVLGGNPFAGEGTPRLVAVVEGRRTPARGRGLPRALGRLLEAMLATAAEARPGAAEVERVLNRQLQPRRPAFWVVSQVVAGLAGVALAYLLLGRGVAADLTRRAPARLAIYPARNLTGADGGEAMARFLLPDLLGAGLRFADRLRVVDPPDLGRAARRLHLDTAKGYGEPVMEKVARAVGAKLFLATVLDRDPAGSLRLGAELRDASGKVRFRTQATVPRGSQGLQVACVLLAEKVAKDLARAVDPLGSAKVPSFPPMDQEALDRYARAEGLLDSGAFREAQPLLQAVAYQYPGFAVAVKGYAHCLSRTGDRAAEPVFLWARMAARAQGNLPEEIHVIQLHVSHLQDLGDWDRALALCQEGLGMAQSLGHPHLLGGLYNQIGTLNQNRGRLAEAESCYDKALAFFKLAEDPAAGARTMNNMAVLEKGRGQLDLAKVHYLEMLTTSQRTGDQWGEGVALSNLGDLAMAMEDLPQAEDFLTRAQRLRTALGDGPGLATTLVNLAGLAQARGQEGSARSQVTQALELSRRFQLRPLEGLCLYNLGELDRGAGRFEAAVQSYRASLALHRDLDDRDMEAHCLAGEAECAARQGDLEGARGLLKASRALAPGENPYVLRTLAWMARGEGREAEARNLFGQAAARARKEAPEILPELKASLGR